MNYEGCVSSINTVQWTFSLDKKVTVHIGHLAAANPNQLLPEIGEVVEIHNAHFKTIFNNQTIEKLFLCERSKLFCKFHKKYGRDLELISLISDYNLGIPDLLEIDYNIEVIDEFIQKLSLQTTDQIIFEVVKSLLNRNSNQTLCEHSCCNQMLPRFTLTTVSKCRYIDLDTDVSVKKSGPVWTFGSHSKSNTNILVGYIQVNKRYGMLLLYDCKHQMPCLITAESSSLKKSVFNKCVLIKDYRVFTETFRELGVPNVEYVMFDVKDVIVLNVSFKNVSDSLVVDTLPIDFPYVYDFQCVLLKKAPVSISDTSIECWLEILHKDLCNPQLSYLGLNAYQMRLIPFIDEHQSYHIYHTEKLKEYSNIELHRLTPHAVSKIFTEKTAIFVSLPVTENDGITKLPILCVSKVLKEMKANNCGSLSFQGLIREKKLTPALSSRTVPPKKILGFGTPGTSTHSLLIADDSGENKVLLYLNNWERLQIPLGLIIDMRICVRNATCQRNKYLKSTAMTTLEVLSYEPAAMFDTVNLCTSEDRTSDKYSYLGLGDRIPCSVLVWSRPVQIFIRSCKIWHANGLNTSVTLFVYDEMGEALIISRSVELLRLLLGLELHQWKIWIESFEKVGEYTYDTDEVAAYSQDRDINIFCQALTLSIKLSNVTKITSIELKCRKMESSCTENEGMPMWFCIDARM